MSLLISPFYAALTTVIFMILCTRVILYRRVNGISLGDSGDKNLLKRIRAQANCAEYAPLGLVLLMMTELSGAPALTIHLAGIALVMGRALHAYGISSTPQKMALRVGGMVLTLTMMGLTSLGLLGQLLF